jgi:2-methylcitrate dehydratase PrpD
VQLEVKTVAVRTEAKITSELAGFAAGLAFEELPSEVVQKAKHLIRDGLGNQLAASMVAEPARVAIGLLREFGGAEQATVVGYGLRLPVPFAAMANAMLGHGIELDDAHRDALTKSGSALIPAVLTTGEHCRTSGRQTIAATVVGYDLMVRIGLAMQPSHRKRGFHTTGTVAAIACAGAAGRQLDLAQPEMNSALGLGAMQSAGIQAYLDDPCMAKPFSPGKGAFNGTLAALLAAKGFTGPRLALESREGFFNAYADEVDLGLVLDRLGSDYKILEVAYKPHAACRYAHGPIDAAQTLKRERDLDPGSIAAVVVRASELALRQSSRTEVPNLNSAMGSTEFGVALALVAGANGLGDYRAGFEDPAVHALAKRVRMVQEPAFGVMGRQAVVEVSTTSGETLAESVEMPKGEPEAPLGEGELRDKFLGLAALAVGAERAREIADLVDRLEDLEDVSELCRATANGGTVGG